MEVTATDTAGLYRRFAEHQARGSSPIYERLCRAVADDDGALALLEALPPAKRQPNLLLGALRLLGAPVQDAPAALAFLHDHTDDVRAVVLSRSTQTNEPARCAVLLPALLRVPGPLALVEIGASAGLCLLLDRWAYRYRDGGGEHPIAPQGGASSTVTLTCDLRGGVPVPDRVPDVAARRGLDPHPLDPADPDVARWLGSLVWPEHTDRAERLGQALAVAAQHPSVVVRGRAPDDLPDVVARVRTQAPDATVVVVHSATLAYLPAAERARTAQLCADLGARRVGLEGPQVAVDAGLSTGAAAAVASVPPGRFALTLDDELLGHAHPHGRDLVWNG